jgi:hypothetical protein
MVRDAAFPLNKDANLALWSVQDVDARWCFTYQGEPMQELGSAWERSLRRAGIEKLRFTICGTRGRVGT